MKKILVYQDDTVKEIYSQSGENLLEVLRKQGYLIAADCGGAGICQKCQVKYHGKNILSCQTTVENDMAIELLSHEGKGLEFGLDNNIEIEVQSGYGIALDLGTTTIAAYLLDLETGNEVNRYSTINLQASYGADVISRIKKCQEGYLNDLHQIIIKEINYIITHFKNNNNIDNIERLLVSGNTIMLHILVNVDPTPLGIAPFTVPFLEKKVFLGNDLGLNVSEVTLLPSISAYIGSDIVSGMLSCKMYEDQENILFVDIGTNGEIILKVNDKYYGTSTAAGPAFEGARIEFGMGGVSGAISQVSLNNDALELRTINNKAPIGICGSALVDIVALLLETKIIDETGLFQKSDHPLCKRLQDDKFYLTERIYISQKDIREFQLAKSAIISGMETLLDYAQISIKQINKLYIAGGFGFYIDKYKAGSVGLLPKEVLDKIIIAGNSSGIGAKMSLLNNKYLEICERLNTNVEVIELSNNQVFTNYFIENMFLK